MTEYGATKPELAAAVIALAALLAYILRRLFDSSQQEKQIITKAYLEHVTSATEAMTKTADSISALATSVNRNTDTLQRHCEYTQKEHAAMLQHLEGKKPGKES